MAEVIVNPQYCAHLQGCSGKGYCIREGDDKEEICRCIPGFSGSECQIKDSTPNPSTNNAGFHVPKRNDINAGLREAVTKFHVATHTGKGYHQPQEITRPHPTVKGAAYTGGYVSRIRPTPRLFPLTTESPFYVSPTVSLDENDKPWRRQNPLYGNRFRTNPVTTTQAPDTSTSTTNKPEPSTIPPLVEKKTDKDRMDSSNPTPSTTQVVLTSTTANTPDGENDSHTYMIDKIGDVPDARTNPEVEDIKHFITLQRHADEVAAFLGETEAYRIHVQRDDGSTLVLQHPNNFYYSIEDSTTEISASPTAISGANNWAFWIIAGLGVLLILVVSSAVTYTVCKKKSDPLYSVKTIEARDAEKNDDFLDVKGQSIEEQSIQDENLEQGQVVPIYRAFSISKLF